MLLNPSRDGIAAKAKIQDNDTGSPIGSGMTEESGGFGKGRYYEIPRFARNDNSLENSAMRWRGYKCKDKNAGSPIGSRMTEGAALSCDGFWLLLE